MGWADCGKDERGRRIGYAFPARCDEKGCNAKIHRGLSYVCGNMHGGDGVGCGGYFCNEHLVIVEMKDGTHNQLCFACYKINKAEDCLVDEE